MRIPALVTVAFAASGVIAARYIPAQEERSNALVGSISVSTGRYPHAARACRQA
ncbi:MAG: hypothetical protein ACI85K_000802 [Hyphomicrobiaceae bacterium]|jgi:hypothetical protein